MIKFTAIRYRNFLSTGNQFTEILLDRSPSTLIVGENGAGKSTILDAICFGLFGKPFRSVNKGQLINSINQKDAEVQIEFSSGKKSYKIVRTIKPNSFDIYCDGSLLNQDASARDYQKVLEDSILKLNYKSFTQIVILGSASFTPFMQLPSGHRREIIEDLLDIQVFTTMNQLLKDKQAELKDSIKAVDGDIEVQKTKANVQKNYIETLEQDKKKKVADVEQLITNTQTEINQYQTQVDSITTQINNLKETIDDSEEVRNKKQTLQVLHTKLVDKIKKAQQEIDFYNNHDSCPTCNQNLTADLKEQSIDQHKNKATEIQTAIESLTQEIEVIHSRLNEVDSVLEQIANLNSEVLKLNNQIIAGQRFIQKVTDELHQAANDTTNIDEEKLKLKELAKGVVSLSERRTQLKEEQQYQDACGALLKDNGIKTKIIRQYLPVINKMVNKYLSAMDFFVSFELDETFTETIKSRHRDDFTYASFSEGEKQRIDLALLFTFRTIAKMKNSANTNLLILDEVFDSSLDANGTDYIMTLLNTLSEDTNAFVISHKGDALFDKFRSVIKFEKHQNYSRIAK